MNQITLTPFILCIAMSAIAQADARVTFELLSGSKLTHEWGSDDTFCRGGGERIVDLVGTFTLVLKQGIDSTGGMLEAIDFRGGDSEYVVSGSGSYNEDRNESSATAEPPNSTVMTLTLVINETIKDISLGVEPIGINTFTFPRIESVLFHQGSMMRRDCFILGIQAAPVAGDLITFFRRGDVNGDRERNLTDAVVLLSSLFRGGGPLSCPDAADANDDGRIDLADAVFMLNYLFSGGEFPSLPTTFCGVDTTQDELDCNGQFACMG